KVVSVPNRSLAWRSRRHAGGMLPSRRRPASRARLRWPIARNDGSPTPRDQHHAVASAERRGQVWTDRGHDRTSVEERRLYLQDPRGGSIWFLDVVVRSDLEPQLSRANLEHLSDIRPDRHDPMLAAWSLPVVRDRRRRLNVPVGGERVAELHLDLCQ